jgi:hypothetical protein
VKGNIMAKVEGWKKGVGVYSGDMGKDPITRPGPRDDGPGNATSRPVGRQLDIDGVNDGGIGGGSAPLPKKA